MSCINFKSSKKNNNWREVKLDTEKEASVLKIFGVDTETRVDCLLQHNLTLFDWIRANQGFPYFIGRRINGENELTKDEINYIISNGSKLIPIFKPFAEMGGKENGKIAIAILNELEIEENTPVFIEVDANSISDVYLKEFANIILNGGYVPGFYVDTDSYYDFDHQYSRAYQADEELMKQCKIWALTPEMEEFFETKNRHNEKPNFWGPFTPSCITKEQICIWQYGKKAHPVNAYDGKRTDFNLNLTIEPQYIFDVKDAVAVSFDFEEDEKYIINATIKADNIFESITLECDFNKVKSPALFIDDKIYAKNIISGHKVLELVICDKNDLLSPTYVVLEGTVLVKLSFISNEGSCVYNLKVRMSLDECDVLRKIISEIQIIEDETEIRNLSKQELWAMKFFKENSISNIEARDEEETDSNVKNYAYKPNEDIFETEILSPILTRSSISGDTYNIFANISQSLVKRSGSAHSTLYETDGNIMGAYYKDTMYYSSNCYISKIAIWELDPNIGETSNDSNNSDRLVEFIFKKAYNAFVYYYTDSDQIKVVYCPDDQTYVVTSETQISVNLVGCQTAYINSCTFEVDLGGRNDDNFQPLQTVLDALAGGVSKFKILGKLMPILSNIAAAFGFLSDIADVITNYNYDSKSYNYAFHPECNLVTKQVGSTFYPVLGFKNSSLKLRAILNNVTFCPNSRVGFQIYTRVLSNFAGNDEFIYLGGTKSLQ